MSIFKSISEFLATGAVLIVSYLLYFVITVVITFVLGLPIALGIKMIIDFINIMFTHYPI
jgi:hypothetical protein